MENVRFKHDKIKRLGPVLKHFQEHTGGMLSGDSINLYLPHLLHPKPFTQLPFHHYYLSPPFLNLSFSPRLCLTSPSSSSDFSPTLWGQQDGGQGIDCVSPCDFFGFRMVGRAESDQQHRPEVRVHVCWYHPPYCGLFYFFKNVLPSAGIASHFPTQDWESLLIPLLGSLGLQWKRKV